MKRYKWIYGTKKHLKELKKSVDSLLDKSQIKHFKKSVGYVYAMRLKIFSDDVLLGNIYDKD